MLQLQRLMASGQLQLQEQPFLPISVSELIPGDQQIHTFILCCSIGSGLKLFCPHLCFCFCFETGFLCVTTLVILKLILQTRLTLNSQGSAYLCLPSACAHHAQLLTQQTPSFYQSESQECHQIASQACSRTSPSCRTHLSNAPTSLMHPPLCFKLA